MTGYLNCNKRALRWERIIDLLVLVVFWSVIITFILGFLNDNILIGWKDYAVSLFPALKGRYWYITSYVFVYFMIPYLNRFIDTMDKNEFKKFLLVCFILLSIIPTFFQTDFFRANTGSSPLWLVICYFFGAYIRKYDFRLNRIKCVLGFIILSLFVLFWQLFCIRFLRGKLNSAWTGAYYSPVTIIMSVLFFVLLVNEIHISSDKIKSLLKWFADGMFGVYIIHAHAQLWDKIIQPAIKVQMKLLVLSNTFNCVIQVVGIIIGIVFITLVIDKIRGLVFKIVKFDKLELIIAGFLNLHFPLT